MNRQNVIDLNRRSTVTSTVLNLLRRAPGLDLLDFNEGLDKSEAVVPANDDGSKVSRLVADGYQFAGITPEAGIKMERLDGLFYPVASRTN